MSNNFMTKRKKSSSPEKEARALKPNLGKLKEAINGKKREFVSRQQEVRETFLIRMLKQESLESLRELIEKRKKKIKKIEDEDRGICPEDSIFMFGSMEYPLKVWIPYYNLELHRYKELIRREEYLKQGLKNEGMTDEELNKLLVDGELKKGLPK